MQRISFLQAVTRKAYMYFDCRGCWSYMLLVIRRNSGVFFSYAYQQGEKGQTPGLLKGVLPGWW